MMGGSSVRRADDFESGELQRLVAVGTQTGSRRHRALDREIQRHLNEPADILVCSANVFLNLSGGVGGAFLLRYGDAMQKELHQFLVDDNRKFVQQGEVVRTSPCGTAYRGVLHAVAVDGFYQSSPATVGSVVRKGLAMSADLGARRVALTALATGYGRLSMRQFAEAVAPLRKLKHHPIEEVVMCVPQESDARELTSALAATKEPRTK